MNRFIRIAVGIAALVAATAATAQYETRASAAGGVTVKVTPKDLGAGANEWVFAVALDTHSQDLTDDLAKTAVLAGADGTRTVPSAWERDPKSDGHHVAGLLRFAPIRPRPAAIELRIQREKESAPRVFRWALDAR